MPQNWQIKRQRLLQMLFKALEPEKMGPRFKQALAAGEENELIAAVAAYFRSRPALNYYKSYSEKEFDKTVALDAANYKVSSVVIPYQFPEKKIDWYYNVTAHNGMPFSNEWQWQLNRMMFWCDMVKYYLASGDETMAEAFNNQLASWVEQTAPPTGDVNAPGSAWRTIEAGLRMMYAWPESFEFFRKSVNFTDENICLMLASMYEQAEFLKKEKQHIKSNWMYMEMQGLYAVGAFFPEFSNSTEFRKYAAELIIGVGRKQLLPDGMQSELSPGYHSVVMNCFIEFCNMAVESGYPEDLPADHKDFIQQTMLGISCNMAPDLALPATNDSGKLYMDKWLKKIDGKFSVDHPTLQWIKSRRKLGSEPGGAATASRFMPWSGFIAMRSSWQSDALYCCFDVGACGSGHWHFDKLNLILFAGSEELLYDDGGGFYELSPQRSYARTTAGHNSVLIDGNGQNYLLYRLDAPAEAVFESNQKFDYASASYTHSYGDATAYYLNGKKDSIFFPATHTRSVRFCKPDCFAVEDFMQSSDGKAHDYQARWQLDTLQVTPLQEYPNSYRAEYKEHDLLIITLTEDVKTKLQQGVLLENEIGGWYHGFRGCSSSTTLAVDFCGTDRKLHTLLLPVKHNAAVPEIEVVAENLYRLSLNGNIHKIDFNNLDKE